MGYTKYALIRYRILDNCFRNNGRMYFIEDLIKECEIKLREIDPNTKGISKRTIQYDIIFMKSADGWNIDLESIPYGKRTYYRYRDSNFSINNMPLSEFEIEQLSSAMDILTQFRGMPQFEWVYELLPKLKQGIQSEGSKEVIMDFESNPFLKGSEYLGILFQAIYYKKVLKISYKPFEAEVAYDLILHPYFLKQYNSRWFLLGFNPEIEKSDWNLALDRIESIQETAIEYIKNDQIDWIEYFDDIIGVTKPVDSKLEDVVLHVIGKTAFYIKSKPLHGSQKDKWISQQILEIKLKLQINYEFQRLLFSYGDSIMVISPKSLKNNMIEGATMLLEAYK